MQRPSEEQANLAIYDPKVPEGQIRHDLGLAESDHSIRVCGDAYEAAEGAHAVLILTEWTSFKSLDYKKITSRCSCLLSFFDGRNILDLEALREIGFESSGIGKGQVQHRGRVGWLGPGRSLTETSSPPPCVQYRLPVGERAVSFPCFLTQKPASYDC